MFERFTDRSRRVVVLAQEEARLLGHDHITTAHLLLGLLAEGEAIPAQLLLPRLSHMEARTIVEGYFPTGHPKSGHLPFTPRSKKVLELAMRESLQLGCNYIAPQHILLGLIREGEGHGAGLLEKTGSFPEIRRAVVDASVAAMRGDSYEEHVADERSLLMRALSERVDDERPIVAFLYLLARDHLPIGTVEEVVRQASDNTGQFTNGWLARWAQDCARRLGGIT